MKNHRSGFNWKGTTYVTMCIALLAAMVSPVAAEMIPPGRVVPWEGNVGVPGGIPSRTTNCTTAACNALYGGTVTAASINNAISSAPVDSVVRLPVGTYDITGGIRMKNRVVLRGAGMNATTLNLNFSGDGITTPQSTYSSSGTLSSGYTKGSNSVVVSSVSGLSVNDSIILYENNDPDIVWSRTGGTNVIRQIVRITGISGNTVTFTPRLVFTYKASLNPGFRKVATMSSYIGLEDMTLNGQKGVLGNIVWYDSCYASWIKNVKTKYTNNAHIFLTRTLFNEIRECYITETTSQNDGFGVYANQLYDFSGANTGLLVENNIFAALWTSVILNNATGCVVAYNYAYNTHTNSASIQTPSYVTQHGPHGLMSLWEGNVGQGIQNDGYHGSGSHQTFFRNHFHGLNPSFTANRKMVDLCRFSYYHNVVGNVLGDPSWTARSYEMTGTPSVTATIYRLGYPHMGNNGFVDGQPPQGTGDSDGSGGLDPKVRATLFRHMNYDYYNSATKYCTEAGEPGCQGGDGSRTLPDSLYLSAKPSWWGSRAWPPIGPDLSPKAGRIPAQDRFEGVAGLKPPTGVKVVPQ